MANNAVGPNISLTRDWDIGVVETRARLGAMLRTSVSDNPETVERITECLATGSIFFNKMSQRPAATIPTEYRLRRQDDTLADNPYFWGGGYYTTREDMNVNVINVGNNYGRTTWIGDNHRVEVLRRQENLYQRRANVAVGLFSIAMASLGTLLATVYYWVIPTASDALKAREIDFEAQQAATDIMRYGYRLLSQGNTRRNQVKSTGHVIIDPRDPVMLLSKIATNLSIASEAERVSKKWKAIGWSCMSILAIGTVHATVSAIALAIISESLTATASATLLNFAAFCTVGCSLPILGALAAIGVVGFIALQVSKNKALPIQEVTRRGLRAYNELNDKIGQSGPQYISYQTPPATAPDDSALGHVDHRPPATAPGVDGLDLPPPYAETVSV